MTMEAVQEALEVFYSYTERDKELRDELDKHLVMLQRQGLITGWYDRYISPGSAKTEESMRHLNAAQIILLLISPDFLSSDYSYGTEVTRAIERHKAGEACVIPILLRSVDYAGTPFEGLSALPTNGVPVKRWSDIDEAFKDVAMGIKRAVLEFDVASKKTTHQNKEMVRTRPSIWNVPYRRNPFFTGRKELLSLLHKRFTASDIRPQAQALSGLGGIGKTQIALEYTYQYRDKYHAVFWVKAASHAKLLADFVAIADLLQLPEKDEQNHNNNPRIPAFQ